MTARCASGTHIATSAGEIQIETLKKGATTLVLSDKEHTPVSNLTSRRFLCARDKAPQDLWPVRIQAGALEPNLPKRDLVVAPDQWIVLNGTLIPIVTLINNLTIAQTAVDEITYWEIEGCEEGQFLAEGIPMGNCPDMESRSAFGSASNFSAMEANLPEVSRQLLARAAEIGYLTTPDPDLHVLSNGVSVAPRLENFRHIFELPAGSRDIFLLSRSVLPAHGLTSNDDRRLGVAVTGIRLDDTELTLADERLGAGWYGMEDGFRWTDGDATVRAEGATRLEVSIMLGLVRYWQSPLATADIASRLVSIAALEQRVARSEMRLEELEIAIQVAYARRYLDVISSPAS